MGEGTPTLAHVTWRFIAEALGLMGGGFAQIELQASSTSATDPTPITILTAHIRSHGLASKVALPRMHLRIIPVRLRTHALRAPPPRTGGEHQSPTQATVAGGCSGGSREVSPLRASEHQLTTDAPQASNAGDAPVVGVSPGNQGVAHIGLGRMHAPALAHAELVLT